MKHSNKLHQATSNRTYKVIKFVLVEHAKEDLRRVYLNKEFSLPADCLFQTLFGDECDFFKEYLEGKGSYGKIFGIIGYISNFHFVFVNFKMFVLGSGRINPTNAAEF